MVDMQKQLPYLNIPLRSVLTENCTRQKTKVGRDKPAWNNGSVKHNPTVSSPSLSHLTAYIRLEFNQHGCIWRPAFYVLYLFAMQCLLFSSFVFLAIRHKTVANSFPNQLVCNYFPDFYNKLTSSSCSSHWANSTKPKHNLIYYH